MIRALPLLLLMAGPVMAETRSVTIVDGDTIRVSGITYRLAGFDTPELFKPKCAAEQRMARKASDRLHHLLATKPWRLERTRKSLDKYGRVLARVFVDGRDVADLLIAEGLARPYAGGKRLSWCG